MGPLPSHEARRLRATAGGDDELFRDLERRRLDGEPLQYLEGTAPFGPLDLVVDGRVLIPRPETEQLWELAIRLAPAPKVVVDLCTGSGALALACKHRWPDARVVGADVSPDAIEVARLNGLRTGLEVEWVVGDLFDPLPRELRGAVDLLVANPPYVAAEAWDDLPEDVRHEPHLALVAGERGTEVIERIGRGCRAWLAPGGVVACEIGEDQAEDARAAFTDLEAPEVLSDLAGRPRFVTTRKPE